MLKYSESPLSQLPYLELFQSEGGASQGVFGGASLETFSGEAQFKKHPVSSPEYGFQHLKHLILCFVPHSGAGVDPRGCVRALDRAFLRGACVLLREGEVFTSQVLLALFDIIKAQLWKVV